MRVLVRVQNWKNQKEYKLEWMRVKDGNELPCLTLIEEPGYELSFYSCFKNENGQIRQNSVEIKIL